MTWGVEIAPLDAEAKLASRVPKVFARAEVQYRGMLESLKGTTDRFPRRFQDGELVTVPAKDWCSGFFAGSMWYLYDYTRSDFWKKTAAEWTHRLECLRHDAVQHDVGFRTYCPAGNALRLTGDRWYADFLHDTAAALRTRYDDRLGLIRSWNSPADPKGFTPRFLVIIDNMMNLELLEWDARNGGDLKSAEVARRHADNTDAHHFRLDGSAYHVLDYDPRNGKVRGMFAGQGATAEGTWARGQSWAIYGFTMMFRETRDLKYLARAERSADYWLGEPNLPKDGVPYWDFHAEAVPDEERDASAAAITASAFLELSTFAAPDKAVRYRGMAVRTLLTLSSDAYLAKAGENGNFILMHSVGQKPSWYENPKSGEVDVPLSYADYYYLEAMVRFARIKGDGNTK